jgi:hypothetical protein
MGLAVVAFLGMGKTFDNDGQVVVWGRLLIAGVLRGHDINAMLKSPLPDTKDGQC